MAFSLWVAVALVGPASVTAFAQAPAETAQEPSRLMPTDRAFAHAVANDAQAEIAIATLAQQTTSSDIVRVFAEEMQHVYLDTAQELREIGDRKHVDLPNVVSQDDQVTLDALSHLSGAAFDRAFAENVIAAHREAIAAFQLYASTGADPELRALADRHLPKLRKLLAAAQDVLQSRT
jgi:putative membrane protein